MYMNLFPMSMTIRHQLALLGLSAALMLGGIPQVHAESSSTKAPPQVSQQYSEMYSRLMLAEYAANNNQPELAFSNYMIVAKWSQDPAIAKTATEYAIDLRMGQAALEASKLWAMLAPEDLQAQVVCATLMLGVSANSAAPYIAKAIQIAPEEADLHLLAIQQRLSPPSQKALFQIVENLAKQSPNDANLHFIVAQLAAQQLDVNVSDQWLHSTLKLNPKHTGAIQLNAKLIRFKAQSDKPALAYLEQQVKKYSANMELKMFYTSALLDNQQIDKALPQLEALVKDKKYKSEALILQSEIYIAQKDYGKAKKTLADASDDPTQRSTAYFLLGHIAERESNPDKAIEWYTQVNEGRHHLTAYLRASQLLQAQGQLVEAVSVLRNARPQTLGEQKQVILNEIEILIELTDYEQALDTVNQALSALPSDIELLYARSVIAGHLNLKPMVERDLLHILELRPDHANALNALGFTLSSQPERFEEARKYIEKAMAISPNNPAYMDSMGWLLFRMGNLKDSKHYLHKAYELSNDSEIAAHLGEVLWSLGEKNQAKDVFAKALKVTPDHAGLLDTLKRLELPPQSLPRPAPQKTTTP